MPIEVRCPYDSGRLRISESSIGRTIRCHWCGGEFEIRLAMATTPEDRRAALVRNWHSILDACSAAAGKRDETFAHLIAAYTEPQRHYHNLTHIVSMLDLLPLVTSQSSDRTARAALKLATWYHDVVYDPRRADNEANSAEVARLSLRELGIQEATVERVCQLILLTKDHQAPEDDVEALQFLDADLLILQTSSHNYASYAQAIRKEYAWVPDREFYEGRRKVLVQFLARSKIFRSMRFSEYDEANARTNLQTEIAQIDEKLRTLAKLRTIAS